MMKTGLIRALVVLGTLIASVAIAEEKAADADKADNGPSLATTMQFIQDKINGQGKVSNAARTSAVTASEAEASTSTCSLNWLEDWEQGSETWTERDDFSLKQVQSLEVLPSPDGFSLKVILLPSASAHYQLRRHNGAAELLQQDGKLPTLTFADETLAKRVAKAVMHAVELCGGGSAEAF